MAPKTQRVGAGGRVFATPEDAPRAAVAAGARTTTGVGSTFNTEDAIGFSATLSITAATGTTPTLDLTLQESLDNGTTWNNVSSFPQKTTTGTHPKTFGPLSPGSICRWSWVIAGTTPSFNFSIDHSAIRTAIGG
jgi:hypothetical protein